MAFDIPSDVILPVDTIDVRLEPGRHPFEIGREAAIAENWTLETRRKPALFDGEIALLSSLGYRDRRLAGQCHIVRYSTFLHWRKERAGTAGHAFAHAMPVSKDGALIAIRMAPHTVNAGRVCFAAGSFEPEDFRDGRVDVEANMQREVLEETSLDLRSAEPEPSYHALSMAQGTVMFKRYRFDEPADALAERIAAHIVTEAEPELAGAIVIRNAGDLPDGLMSHMRQLIDWHFQT